MIWEGEGMVDLTWEENVLKLGSMHTQNTRCLRLKQRKFIKEGQLESSMTTDKNSIFSICLLQNARSTVVRHGQNILRLYSVGSTLQAWT